MKVKKIIYILWVAAISIFPLSSLAEAKKSSVVEQTEQHNEIALLTAQIASMENYQSQLISIVIWSLSSVIAMALGLAAFNWYTSKVSYEREMQALNQESDAKLQEMHSALKTSVDEYSKKLVADLDSKSDEIKNAAIKEIQKRIESLTLSLKEQKSRILKLEYDNKERLAEEAMGKGRLEWSVYQYCDLLAISVEQGSDHYQVGEILDEISKALDDPKISMSSDDVSRTIAALKNLPKRHQAAAENIIPKVNRAYGKA
ncbi:hypothetical protein [Hydrocarboniclastica marina]|uniref:Uncharacterized protein n=1 Tax=Hydrocarboniclastica marina TaxID=2259620 RepID=A0A4P7XDD0_9ALTE|nr:hypothetical protein [Hydrocarboniclastica marina]QCF24595.1 hypothetical protein soil367_00725 [Hydrocarboniclastica marina]